MSAWGHAPGVYWRKGCGEGVVGANLVRGAIEDGFVQKLLSSHPRIAPGLQSVLDRINISGLATDAVEEQAALVVDHVAAVHDEPVPAVALGVPVKPIVGVHPSELSFVVQYVTGAPQGDPVKISKLFVGVAGA